LPGFLAIYRRWEDEEAAVVVSLVEKRAGHGIGRGDRRASPRASSVPPFAARQLSVENAQVRMSRLRQMENTIALAGRGTVETLAQTLFQIERRTPLPRASSPTWVSAGRRAQGACRAVVQTAPRAHL